MAIFPEALAFWETQLCKGVGHTLPRFVGFWWGSSALPRSVTSPLLAVGRRRPSLSAQQWTVHSHARELALGGLCRQHLPPQRGNSLVFSSRALLSHLPFVFSLFSQYWQLGMVPHLTPGEGACRQ